MTINVLYIQYGGDYAEGYQRLIADNGKENYYGQRCSVEAVVAQARRGLDVQVLVLLTDQPYEIQLEPHLKAIGMGCSASIAQIIAKIRSCAPDRVVLRTPNVAILKFIRKNNIAVLPVFADSFEHVAFYRVKTRFWLGRLARELRAPHIRWVANHQLNAAKSLVRIGVSPDKIIPYDWQHPSSPEKWSKSIPSDITTKTLRLFYAGMMIEEKGVVDLFNALTHLHNAGRRVALQCAGKGDAQMIKRWISQAGVEDLVTVLGLVDHDEVLRRMNQADLTIVPSRHCYPEGLPMTIMESLMVHTPVVASDHPMFVGRVGSFGAVTFFKQMNSQDLARAIMDVCNDASGYAGKCESTATEWHKICLDLKWADLVDQWIEDPQGVNFKKYALTQFIH